MLKRHGKKFCGHACAKSIRLVLEPYAEYLTSQVISVRRLHRYVRAVEHFGTWIGRRKVCKSVVQEFLDEGLLDC